jgi:hypothetical protein
MGVSINMESVSHHSWVSFLYEANKLGISLPLEQYPNPDDFDVYTLNGEKMKKVLEEFESKLEQTRDAIFVLDKLKIVLNALEDGESVTIGL